MASRVPNRHEFRTTILSSVVGRGPAAFEAASAAVLSLRMHRAAGLRMSMPTDRVRVGDVVRIRLGLGRLTVSGGSCEVFEVFDEPRRQGFSYRTRPDHLEDGEESFLVELAADDRVLVTVTATSRPNHWLTRLGGPFARQAQRIVNGRYLRAVSTIVAGG
jgi:uncharacterized protein (UPF0548 family)